MIITSSKNSDTENQAIDLLTKLVKDINSDIRLEQASSKILKNKNSRLNSSTQLKISFIFTLYFTRI